ncbi:MAG: UV damage endonuclease UvsE, partial [Intestinibacter sp.]|nr:UV damage endonuclease UvsE [Intestinibacter sp.]
MKIRLGYVAISNALGNKVTSSSNVTYKTYSKLNSQEKRIQKLKSITSSNFNALEKIIRYNIENDIHFYRITSALIPLTTHPEVPNWEYRKIFKKDFEYIGKLIRQSNMRVDTHPDQFNVINSAKDEVVQNTIRNLSRQVEWFEDLNYPEGKMVIHVGGATGGKEAAL